MKLTKRIGVYVIFLLSFANNGMGHIRNQQAYFVYAESGLSLRNDASLEAEKIATIPYGSEVLALSDSLYGLMVSVEEFAGLSLQGYWKHIEYDTLQGYVFEPYLCRLKPSKTHKNDKEYFQKVTGQVGDKYNLKFYNLDCASNPVGCICGYETEYNYGITYKYYSCRENGVEVEVVLPEIGLNQAFLFGKMLYQWGDDNSFTNFQSWNEIRVKPIDSGAGCYYTIQPYGKGGTRLTYYCGC